MMHDRANAAAADATTITASASAIAAAACAALFFAADANCYTAKLPPG